MFKWDSVFEWGRRASDREAPAPVNRVRDSLLETVIANEGIEVRYQPLIEPKTGRILRAEALTRSSIADTAHALFTHAAAAGLTVRLSTLVQRKAPRSAV